MQSYSVHNSLNDSNNIYLFDCLLETHHLPLMPHPHHTHQPLHPDLNFLLISHLDLQTNALSRAVSGFMDEDVHTPQLQSHVLHLSEMPLSDLRKTDDTSLHSLLVRALPVYDSCNRAYGVTYIHFST